MILDFKEIPEANKGGGLQDTFELFAREFLKSRGYRVISDPNRGPDGKVDFIVEESCRGIDSEFPFRWLVSCKHFARSGKSVSDSDEINIRERLEQHGCDGFMGFYSTVCSSSLGALISSMCCLNGKKNAMVYDREKIERYLLRNKKGQKIASRFFPQSYERYMVEFPIPADIFECQDPLRCECCGKSLMDARVGGVCCFLRKDTTSEGNSIDDVYFSCKGECDAMLRYSYKELQGFQEVGWNDISDYCMPKLWISEISSFLLDTKNHRYSEEAFNKMKMLYEKTFPWVSRHLTSKEKERYKDVQLYQVLQLL